MVKELSVKLYTSNPLGPRGLEVQKSHDPDPRGPPQNPKHARALSTEA